MPIDAIKPHLALAISLLETVDPRHGDMPMGLDSPISNKNGIFVSGVFSKIAIMVIHKKFLHLIPDNFSVYEFADVSNTIDGKFFYPKVGFKDDNYAVTTTILSSQKLATLHEKLLTQ